jgi:hypothetical protein
MRLSRRPLFFLAVAIVSIALIPMNVPEYRLVNYVMIGMSGFWAVILGLEDLFGPGRRPPRGGAHVDELPQSAVRRASGRSTR